MNSTFFSSGSSQSSTMPHSGSQSSQSIRTDLINRHSYSGTGIPAYFAARRHKKILRDNLKAAMNKPTIRRLARRGGIMRIKSDIYPTVQELVRERLKLLIEYASELVQLAGRKTMTALDVVYALRCFGSPIYGYGFIEKGEGIADHAARYKEKKRQQAENRERVARFNASRSATRFDINIPHTPADVNANSHEREMQNQRIDALMRQMKRGTRC